MLVEKKKKREAEVPMASLADIAFLLLIFFLVTTTIDVDRGIGLTLPAKGEETEVRSKNIANLLINAQGEVFIDDEVIGVHEIARVVREKLIQNPQLIISEPGVSSFGPASVAISENGTAVAAWGDTFGKILASQYNGSSWSSPVIVSGPGDNEGPDVGMDDSGNAFLVSAVTSGANKRTYASRFNGTSWSPIEFIDSDLDDAFDQFIDSFTQRKGIYIFSNFI